MKGSNYVLVRLHLECQFWGNPLQERYVPLLVWEQEHTGVSPVESPQGGLGLEALNVLGDAAGVVFVQPAEKSASFFAVTI